MPRGILWWSDTDWIPAPLVFNFVAPTRAVATMPVVPSPLSEFHLQQTVRKAGDVPPTGPLPPPASGRIGSYELIEELARGGMGIVYKAQDTKTGRVVAVKIMRDLPAKPATVRERFRREAEVVTRLDHPGIVRIQELGWEGERCYLVMDFIPGGTLHEHLNRFLEDHRLAVAVMEQIARAIHHAHEHGILHRDLKPGNVLLDEDSKPLVTDFGLAKYTSGSVELTDEGELIGTPAYMSPEQAAGHAERFGPATDVWGLGAMLFELLTGCKPFPGDDRSIVLQAILHAAPVRPRSLRPALDAQLEQIVITCLTKDPAGRYPSAAALADDLGRWLRSEPVRPDSRHSGTCRAANSRRRHVVGSVLAVGLLVVGLAICLSRGGTSKVTPETAIQQLARGERLDLLVPNGPAPAWHRWVAGETRNLRLNPLTMQSLAPSMLEILPRVPVRHYRIDAEMESEGIALGDAGVYFAHQEAGSGTDREHLFCAFTFNQTAHRNRALLAVHRYRESEGEEPGYAYNRESFTFGLPEVPPLPVARKIAIEVTPEKVVAFWEGKRIGEVAWTSLQAQARALAAREPTGKAAGELDPGGGAGLSVTSGIAAFLKLSVEPIR